VKQRDRVAMTPAEIGEMLGGGRKLQLATLNADGSVHLVSMYYTMLDGRIAFWTYRTSQKAVNMARDPRVTCLIEEGSEYFDLRGVSVTGTVTVTDDPEMILAIGRRVAGGIAATPDGALDEYVEHAARKRLGYLVDPARIVSWDHRKLLG
jgi:nitroimidazol reductase NimA-like FMN-containing flavoprotein (pyridoxamine 5'-phosphate oxidase superfamily)